MGHGGDVAALPHSRRARPSPLCNLNRRRPVKECARCFRAQAVGPAREANMYRARRQTMRGANKWFVALSTALVMRVDAPTAWAMAAMLLHSHTHVRPDLPLCAI